MSDWYKNAKLGRVCKGDTRCGECKEDGSCESCQSIEGRFVECVNEYASTCDSCGNLTHHDHLSMDVETQLGYCPECIEKLPEDIKRRLEKKEN